MKTKIETFFKLLQHCVADLLRSRAWTIFGIFIWCFGCWQTVQTPIIFMNWHLFGDRFLRAHKIWSHISLFHCFFTFQIVAVACVKWVLCKHEKCVLVIRVHFMQNFQEFKAISTSNYEHFHHSIDTWQLKKTDVISGIVLFFATITRFDMRSNAMNPIPMRIWCHSSNLSFPSHEMCAYCFNSCIKFQMCRFTHCNTPNCRCHCRCHCRRHQHHRCHYTPDIALSS